MSERELGESAEWRMWIKVLVGLAALAAVLTVAYIRPRLSLLPIRRRIGTAILAASSAALMVLSLGGVAHIGYTHLRDKPSRSAKSDGQTVGGEAAYIQGVRDTAKTRLLPGKLPKQLVAALAVGDRLYAESDGQDGSGYLAVCKTVADLGWTICPSMPRAAAEAVKSRYMLFDGADRGGKRCTVVIPVQQPVPPPK